MTNYQMIKNMSIDDLADFIEDMSAHCMGMDCEDCPIGKYYASLDPAFKGIVCSPKIIKEWLKMNTKGGEVINKLEDVIADIVNSNSITHKDTILPMLRDVVLRMKKHQYEEVT